MKHIKIMASLMTLATCSLIVACGNTKKDDESYSYEFSFNGCKTEKQTFSSKEAMCEGLQDEVLNKGCAVASRKDFFKSQGCEGTFTSKTKTSPSTQNQADVPPGKAPNLEIPKLPENTDKTKGMTGMEVVTVAADKTELLIFKSSPEQAQEVRNDGVEFTCIQNIEELKSRKLQTGILMMNQSQVLIRLGADATGHTPENPLATVKCSRENKTAIIPEMFEDKKIQTRVLKEGESILDVVRTARLGDNAVQSFTVISCNKDLLQAAFTGNNGLNLKTGSRILFHRELNYTFADGTSSKAHDPLVMVICD